MTIRLPIVAVVALALAAAAGGSGQSASTAAPATAIAAGLGQSCALTRAGGVKCWGANGHDELGNGTMRDSRTPVDVSGLSSGVTAIATGVRHGCALTRSGGVRCWGHSSAGTLGDGTNTRRFTPVDVSGLSSGVTAVAAGGDHSCALTSAGGVRCWGYNRFGALGDGTTSDRWTPVEVSGLSSGVTAIAAGFAHSCALMAAGGVKCWGNNFRGELGDGTTSQRLTPVDVLGLGGGVVAIAAGTGYSCALTSARGIKCWGLNEHGQLGDGTTSQRLTPVDVSGLSSGVTAIAAGAGHSCALTSTGGVKCWGLNEQGELGDGTNSNRLTPVDVSGLSRGVTAVAAGAFHSCAVAGTGGIKCWGLNEHGQLGDGTTVNRRTPVGVRGFGASTATLAIVSRAATVTRARVAALKLRCGDQARCRGTLALTAAGMRLGRAPFSIAPGRSQDVRVKLTPRAFELLARVKRLTARIRISYEQPAGSATTATRTITLVGPKG